MQRRKRAERALTSVCGDCYLPGVSTCHSVKTRTKLPKPQVSIIQRARRSRRGSARRCRPCTPSPPPLVPAGCARQAVGCTPDRHRRRTRAERSWHPGHLRRGRMFFRDLSPAARPSLVTSDPPAQAAAPLCPQRLGSVEPTTQPPDGISGRGCAPCCTLLYDQLTPNHMSTRSVLTSPRPS